jgi:hypothetical protein
VPSWFPIVGLGRDLHVADPGAHRFVDVLNPGGGAGGVMTTDLGHYNLKAIDLYTRAPVAINV